VCALLVCVIYIWIGWYVSQVVAYKWQYLLNKWDHYYNVSKSASIVLFCLALTVFNLTIILGILWKLKHWFLDQLHMISTFLQICIYYCGISCKVNIIGFAVLLITYSNRHNVNQYLSKDHLGLIGQSTT